MMQYASAASSAERKPSVELDAIPMAMLSNCCDMLSLKFASDHLDTCGTYGSEWMEFA